MTMPGAAGLISNNTNINVNAGAGSIVNVEVINANTLGPALYPAGPLNLFAGDSPYSYPALLPSFLGAPRVDLMPSFTSPPAATADPAQPVKAPDTEPQKKDGCMDSGHHHHKPHKAHHRPVHAGD